MSQGGGNIVSFARLSSKMLSFVLTRVGWLAFLCDGYLATRGASFVFGFARYLLMFQSVCGIPVSTDDSEPIRRSAALNVADGNWC